MSSAKRAGQADGVSMCLWSHVQLHHWCMETRPVCTKARTVRRMQADAARVIRRWLRNAGAARACGVGWRGCVHAKKLLRAARKEQRAGRFAPLAVMQGLSNRLRECGPGQGKRAAQGGRHGAPCGMYVCAAGTSAGVCPGRGHCWPAPVPKSFERGRSGGKCQGDDEAPCAGAPHVTCAMRARRMGHARSRRSGLHLTVVLLVGLLRGVRACAAKDKAAACLACARARAAAE